MSHKLLYKEIFQGSCDYTQAMCIYYCAPVIFKLKASGIVTLCKYKCDITNLEDTLNSIGLKTFSLCNAKEKAIIMIYSPELISKVLSTEKSKDILKRFGYQNLKTTESKLELLKRRYTDYMLNSSEYPHEIGLFLDYPPDDVIDFIDNKPCKLCGYWKVYNNEEYAKRIFSIYDKAREIAVKKFVSGNNIKEIANILLKEA